MKKILSVLLALALLAGLPAAFADGNAIGTEEELAAAIRGYREQNASEFELLFTKEYFEVINGYSPVTDFRLQMMLAGAEDGYSARYSIGETYLKLEGVKWTEPSVVLCSAKEDIAAAFEKFLADGKGEFTIVVKDEALADEIMNGKLVTAYAAQQGVQEMDYSYSYGVPRLFVVKDIVRFTAPYAVAKDSGEFAQALEYMAERGEREFTVVATPELYEELNADDGALFDRLEACSPIEDRSCRDDRYYRAYRYTDVTYSNAPRVFCDSREDMVETIRQMGASGIADFNLVLSKELFETLYVDYHFIQDLYDLQAEAGLTDCDMKYDYHRYVLYYTGARIQSDAVKLSTPQEANEYVAKCVEEGKDDIALFCTPELYTVLIGNINPYVNFRVGMSPIFDVTLLAGINDYQLFFSESSHMIELRGCTYYPGTKIVKAVQSGDASGLTAREREAMDKALAIAERCKADDPLETARAIHDELCAIITYKTEEEQNDGDTAVGCLLDGLGDCDGYADSFYLVGTLAGLNVRRQHGDSHDMWGSLLADVTHAWNVLEIDGTWRLVDVTWDDDAENGVRYTWFNLGEDRARRMHIWNNETSTELLPVTDLSARPANEYLVTSAEDVAAAAKDAVANGYKSFFVIYDTPEHADRSAVFGALSDEIAGPFMYSWNDFMLMMSVYME